jgi:hypothetical protein
MDSRGAVDRYVVTPLPFIPFSNTGGEALSHDGVVAGGVSNPDGTISLAVWRKGSLTNLGVPPGLPSHEFNKPRVFGINASGAIVGTVHTSAGDLPSRWFVYDRGEFTVLPLADPTDRGGAAIGINNRGTVVGYDRTARNNVVGWLWDNDRYVRLPVSGSSTAALGINSAGTIIGNRSLSRLQRLLTGHLRRARESGYVVSRGATRYLSGFVYAINDTDEAAGGSLVDGKPMATVFTNGVATALLRLPSFAVGINSSCHVVGSYEPAGRKQRHLFVWSASSGALDLTPDGYRSAEAAAINDHGEILGFGETVEGIHRYFMLTPDPSGALVPTAIDDARSRALANDSPAARADAAGASRCAEDAG